MVNFSRDALPSCNTKLHSALFNRAPPRFAVSSAAIDGIRLPLQPECDPNEETCAFQATQLSIPRVTNSLGVMGLVADFNADTLSSRQLVIQLHGKSRNLPNHWRPAARAHSAAAPNYTHGHYSGKLCFCLLKNVVELLPSYLPLFN